MTDLTPIEAELLEAVLDPRIPAEQVPATPEQRAAWAGRSIQDCGPSRSTGSSSGDRP